LPSHEGRAERGGGKRATMNDITKTPGEGTGVGSFFAASGTAPPRWTDEEIAAQALYDEEQAERHFALAEQHLADAAVLRGPKAERAYCAARMGRRWYDKLDAAQIARERLVAAVLDQEGDPLESRP
jgi:hypothetical protein